MKLLWLIAAGVTLLALLAWAVVIYDFHAEQRGLPTVSAWLLWWGERQPWIAAVLGAVAGVLLGVLIGHLWFPQTR